MNPDGRPKDIPAGVSMSIVNAACQKAGGPYLLAKQVGISHPHLSRARTGENQVSRKYARKLVKFLGWSQPDWRVALSLTRDGQLQKAPK